MAQVRQMHLALEYLVNLLAVLVQRRDHDVRGLIATELNDEFGEIGFIGADTGGFERSIETDLLGSHRFDLEDLSGAWRIMLFGRDCFLCKSNDDLACLFSIAGPVDDAARTRTVQLELFEVG